MFFPVHFVPHPPTTIKQYNNYMLAIGIVFNKAINQTTTIDSWLVCWPLSHFRFLPQPKSTIWVGQESEAAIRVLSKFWTNLQIFYLWTEGETLNYTSKGTFYISMCQWVVHYLWRVGGTFETPWIYTKYAFWIFHTN